MVLLFLAFGLWLFAAASGWLGSQEEAGEIHAGSRPAATMEAQSAVQNATARMFSASPQKQVLFGDFHVHTTFSSDAFLMGVPLVGGKR